MNIVILSPAHPLRGGIAASSERLAAALQSQGHNVEIFSFKLQYPGFLFPGKTQFTSEPAPPGIRIFTVLNSINPFNWLRTGWLLARRRPDLVICRFWLPFMGPCLGTVLRIARWLHPQHKTVALVDNIVPHEKRPGDRWFARYFAKACDRFVVMSQSVEEEIRTFSGSKQVRYAPHPVYDIYGEAVEKQTARRRLNIPENEPVVLFFGFIRAYKGLDILLEALGIPDLKPVHAVVAGECYEDWAPYQAIIDRHDLQARVHLFTDFIPNEQVALFFSAADLVVQPYKTATQSGISQIAYHFNKPMVVTHVGGLPEIVQHGISGYVVAPNAEAISNAIANFFKNADKEKMIEGVRTEKKRFSWENLTNSLLHE